MSSPTYATKRAALHQVLEQLERAHEWKPVLPEAFADTGELLAMAHQRWHSHLGARIDAALESGEPPSAAVGSAYRDAVRFMPQLRRLLDDHADHPVLVRAEQRELSLFAWAAGLTPYTTPAAQAAELGREFRNAVSAGVRTREPVTDSGTGRSWLRRVRDAIAA